MATITGTSAKDSLIGTSSDDLILGLAEKDSLRGGGGNDALKGGTSADNLNGESGRDTLQGEGGADLLLGSSGNDILDGGASSDVADYSRLTTAITLGAVGVVNKGSFGIDQILGIERIIGRAGQTNSINGSTGTSGVTSFDIDLKANRLTVLNVPGLGNVNFAVENFVNVVGTGQSDNIIGSNGNNIIEGGNGADSFEGTGGSDKIAGNNLAGVEDNSNDTIDYTGLGVAISLLPTGIVNKGSLGTDELIRVETIIGEAGQDNTISAAGNSGASINVDLAAESLQAVITTPNPLSLNRTIKNFVNVVGSLRKDNIKDNSLDNVLTGNDGNDTIQSTGGDDLLLGNSGRDTLNADLGQDTLIGGLAGDFFVLGKGSSISFDDAGSDDFATINDFGGDTDILQLGGNASLYSVSSSGNTSSVGVDINNNGIFDTSDELIARINGSFDFATDVIFAV